MTTELLYNSDDYYDLPTIRFYMAIPPNAWPYTLWAAVFPNGAVYYQKCDKNRVKTELIRTGIISDPFSKKEFYENKREYNRAEIEEMFGPIPLI